ncbi:TetR/AcrR family transcriptional regulator [Rhizobium sp. TRM95111]|uniref:TetR/AcrR family transcriptional regulator n=1 Tax=Rhizobium alarense TaxID=2846851 RepID=UPI001F4682FD|nr:TetR/AcrR family transcriptional regulator [Rhizobium alarense]MCF3641175.1 TetR/AcrR family transcriptional regulator [Rhizobium alarense]
MEISDGDPRRAAILEAAFTVFTTYGFRRSNMGDIAAAAGLSRPALYQHFRNKEDIFRAYVVIMKAATVATIVRAFAAQGPFTEKLGAALSGAFLEPHRLIRNSPHGEELIGVNKEIAADLFASWMAEVEAAFRDAFAREAAAGALDLSRSRLDPQRLARLVVDAMEGIKTRRASLEDAERSVADLVALVTASAAR